MKIAVWHNLPSGGGKRALYQQVRSLLERGHTVKAWCPSTADQSYLPLSSLVEERVLPFSFKSFGSLNPVSRAVASYRVIVDNLAAMDRHCRDCADEINAGDFDLVFANTCAFFFMPPIGRYVRAPKVIYLGEPCRWLYEAMPRLRWAALPLEGWSRWKPSQVRKRVSDAVRIQGMRIQAREELKSAQAFDSILVNSLYSRESVLRAYGLNSKVCYLGIDTNLFKDGCIPRQDFVVGIGEIKWPKNIHFIIEALGAMTGPRPRLVWIGNEASPSYLEDLEQLAVARKVIFEPRVRVSDQELVDTLNRALAMVYAPRLEPFGLAPLEANACALPVIAVAEGGVRETIQDRVNGLLVEHEPRSMAAAVEQLRDQPGYARELGERARQLVRERWSLPASADRLEQRFAEVLEARRR